MKKFIEKLIGMLEEEKQRLRNLKNDCVALSDHEVIAIEEGAYNFCKNIVNQLAEEYINTSTDTSSGWVACSERLPEESGEYLTFVDYDDDKFIAIDEFSTEGILAEWNCTPNYRVIAWQPLPQPYKEGE